MSLLYCVSSVFFFRICFILLLHGLVFSNIAFVVGDMLSLWEFMEVAGSTPTDSISFT
jgi:hypothetical protein